ARGWQADVLRERRVGCGRPASRNGVRGALSQGGPAARRDRAHDRHVTAYGRGERHGLRRGVRPAGRGTRPGRGPADPSFYVRQLTQPGRRGGDRQATRRAHGRTPCTGRWPAPRARGPRRGPADRRRSARAGAAARNRSRRVRRDRAQAARGRRSMNTTNLLHDARAAEKEQALFYRSLAALAEERGDTALAERLTGLHADEQHHLSLLTARLVALNEPLADLSHAASPAVELGEWESVAQVREADEIARYEMLLAQDIDADTRAMIESFLEAERAHERELGGKWMDA